MHRSMGLLLGVVLVSGWWGVTGHGAVRPAPRPAEGSSSNALLLERPWVDHMPRAENDRIGIFIFNDENYGAQVGGTRYSWSGELFEFEQRDDDRLHFHYLTGHEKLESKYSIREETNGEFDLVMELSTDPARRGSTQKYFSRVDWQDGSARPAWLQAVAHRPARPR